MNNLLIESVRNGNLEGVINALNNGADIHAQNNEALILAARNGRLEVVRFLLQKGADIHAQSDQSLINAAFHSHLEVVQFLLDRGADIHARDDQALISAAFNGHLEVVRFLLQKGANIHAQNDQALIYAAFPSHLEVAQLLIENGANINVLSQEQRNQVLKEIMPIIAENSTETVIQDPEFIHVCNAGNDFEGVQPLDPILGEPIPSNLIISVQSGTNNGISCFNAKSLWKHWITQSKKNILTERYASNPLNRGYFDENSVIYVKELLDREKIKEEQESYKIIKDQILYDQVMNSNYQELKKALNQDLFPKLTEQQIQADIENITYEYRMAVLNMYRESKDIKYTLEFVYKYSRTDMQQYLTQYTTTIYEDINTLRYMVLYYLYENNLLDEKDAQLLINNSDKFEQILKLSNTAQELRNNLLHVL